MNNKEKIQVIEEEIKKIQNLIDNKEIQNKLMTKIGND